MFKLDALNGFVALGVLFFTGLVLLYSSKFMQKKPQLLQYYGCIVLSAIASLAVVLANNLILLLAAWGFLGLTLYLLINLAGPEAAELAKKSFIIVGGTDALMLLGIGIIYALTGTFQLDKIRLEINSFPAVTAYLCIAAACFAKAGLMPFHSWIPDCAQKAPLPVVAFLPASLDKLLGIYLLARLSLNLFIMNNAMNALLMLMGAFTILAAVMMALVQHNLKRLLGYHAVSQVGYMVLGIGTGNPIGIAGGIFHMLNHAVYKSCLFFTAGSVEYRARTSELDELGGLAKFMPLTYISCLVASLSISGVPPFNGFVSKWMVYQGLISRLQSNGPGLQAMISVFCLTVAMFGSGLTLASFMKVLHAVFLGAAPEAKPKPQGEVNWQMWLPCIILAITCVVFGVFAYQIPLKMFIFPAIGGVAFLGSWQAVVSTALVTSGLILGFWIFKLQGAKPALRQDAAFVGGESIDLSASRVTGLEFYNSVRDYGILKNIYRKAEAGFFDFYRQAEKLSFIPKIFQRLHNGALPTYLAWILLGAVGLMLLLVK
ncbi:MAG: proton-conducting transporter membrane subunit [Candidatus Omnitrophota bacterium]